MNADPVFDLPVNGDPAIAVAHPKLDLYAAGDRVQHTREFREHAITHEFHDAAAMLGDPPLDQFFAVCLQSRECAGLVNPQQTTVADHICGQYCGEASVHPKYLSCFEPASHAAHCPAMKSRPTGLEFRSLPDAPNYARRRACWPALC